MLRNVQIEDLLSNFYSGKASYEDLIGGIHKIIESSASDKEALAEHLKDEFESGHLPAQIYFTLQHIFTKPRQSAINPDLEDETILYKSPDTQVFNRSAEPTKSLIQPDSSRQGDSLVVSNPDTLDSNLAKVDLGTPLIPLKLGLILKDQYQLEQELGAGGMGIVFKARDLLMEEMHDRDPFVAIKILRPELRNNKNLLIALQREFRKAQKLAHPNIIHVMDFTRDLKTGYVFLSMQYLHGQTLNAFINQYRSTGLRFKSAWPIIKSMADALGYAHQNHIVHMDFKPSNVFISKSGETKVLDFGIANVMTVAGLDDQTTVFNPQELGALTPAYASLEMLENLSLPEHERHLPDPRDDIYALACVTYELLTGRHPFGKANASDASKAGLQPKPPTHLSHRQWHGLKQALSFKRNQRTATIEEFIHDVGKLSPLFWRSTIGIGLAGIAVAITYFVSPQQIIDCQPPQLSPEANARIKDLLEVASVHLEVGYLTTPPASNALLAYQEVLKINPCDNEAKLGLNRIADELEQSAWAAFETGNRALSLEKVNEGLRANPSHEGLLSLKRKISL